MKSKSKPKGKPSVKNSPMLQQLAAMAAQQAGSPSGLPPAAGGGLAGLTPPTSKTVYRPQWPTATGPSPA